MAYLNATSSTSRIPGRGAVRARMRAARARRGRALAGADGLGLDATSIENALAKITSYAAKLPTYAKTIAEVIDDPYLPEVACRVDQIYDAHKHYAVTPCTQISAPAGTSIIFGKAMPVIRGAAYAEQHLWVYPVFFGLLFGIPAAIGWKLGRRSRA